MTDYRYIKKLVEMESGVEDIGIKSRETFVRDCRYTYMKLCFKYVVDFGLSNCGKEVNRDHSTVLHGIKVFNQIYGTKNFKTNNIFVICDSILKTEYLKLVSNVNSKSIIALDLIIWECKNLKQNYLKILNIE